MFNHIIHSILRPIFKTALNDCYLRLSVQNSIQATSLVTHHHHGDQPPPDSNPIWF